MTEYGRIHTDGSRSGGQPTQSDALKAENERLRERLRITLEFALAYAEGTGSSFDYAMTLAQDELDDLRAQEQSK